MTEFSTQRPIRVAIIGGGMSGISQAIRLKKTLGAKVEIKVRVDPCKLASSDAALTAALFVPGL